MVQVFGRSGDEDRIAGGVDRRKVRRCRACVTLAPERHRHPIQTRHSERIDAAADLRRIPQQHPIERAGAEPSLKAVVDVVCLGDRQRSG